MTDFAVTLVPYDQTWTFSKEKFTLFFPDSVLTPLLRDNDSVDLTHSDVIPEALNIIHEFTNGQGDITTISNPSGISTSGNYLGIDLLNVITNRHFPDWNTQYHPLMLVQKHRLWEHYREFLTFSVGTGYESLARYVLTKFPVDNKTLPIDKEVFFYVIVHRSPSLVKLLLPRVDPMTVASDEPEKFVLMTEDEKHDEVHDYLPSDIVFSDDNENREYYRIVDVLSIINYGHPLMLALMYDEDSARIIMKDPRVTDPTGEILLSVASNDSMKLSQVRELLSHFRYSKPILDKLRTIISIRTYTPLSIEMIPEVIQLIDQQSTT